MICIDLAKSSLITLPDESTVRPLPHETCSDRTNANGNYRSCSGYSMDPVYTGRFTADSNGEVKFAFENHDNVDNQHVKFSGIAVRPCEVSGITGNIFTRLPKLNPVTYCILFFRSLSRQPSVSLSWRRLLLPK